jgi:adenine deaminase
MKGRFFMMYYCLLHLPIFPKSKVKRMSLIIRGNLVDIDNKRTFPAEVIVRNGKISSIRELESSDGITGFILPGFIDSHVHIESSMLVPAEFARLAVVHGTVATISDPHEIANVCGLDGVEYMIENGRTVPFKFYFGAPSCVPATTFETAGAELDSVDVDRLLQREEVRYLSEMMNFPGVLNGDEEVMRKIASARKHNKPVDGHAPGLRGEAARKYIEAGISTDHECFTSEEALEKLQYGMKIIIREGSAAKNFEALIGLLEDHPDDMMFCSDDKHPDSLVEGHINQLCARAVSKGIDVYKVLKAACINPVLHYKLDVGLLKKDETADLIIVRDLEHFEVLATYIDGELVSEKGKTMISPKPLDTPEADKADKTVNNFNCRMKKAEDFIIPFTSDNDKINIPVIEAMDGQLITNRIITGLDGKEKTLEADIPNDILKIVVVNRYHDAPIAKGFIKNFGLKKGAIASSVAHDSHNIVAVGVDDESICEAVNAVIECMGGVSCVGIEKIVLPLPVAGLMSKANGYEVAEQYAAIDKAAKALGSKLSAPFMTLSFMALLVIPHLKLSDKGLFDADRFQLIDLLNYEPA